MGPEIILGVNKILTENKPKTFEEFRKLIDGSQFKDLSDEALEAFGIRKGERAPVLPEVKKTERKPKEAKKIFKSVFDCYIELLSEVKVLKQKIKENVEWYGDKETENDMLSNIDNIIEKHTKLIKENDIWE